MPQVSGAAVFQGKPAAAIFVGLGTCSRARWSRGRKLPHRALPTCFLMQSDSHCIMTKPLPPSTILHIDVDPKTRISVPIDAETRAVFQKLADASGVSLGRAIADWLRDTLDAAMQMAAMVEKAKERPRQAIRELNAMARGLVEVSEEFAADVRSGKALAERKRSAPASPTPRPVIRGVKSPGKPRIGR